MYNMDIALLDPDLHTSAGHHLDVDLKILREVKRRGHRVSVFAHQKLDTRTADLLRSADRVSPLFRVSAYGSPSLTEPSLFPAFFDPLSGSLAHFIDGAKAIAEDPETLKDFDLWLWPSLSASRLPACADASPATRTSGCIHVEPDFGMQVGSTFWRYAFCRAMDAELATGLWPFFVYGVAAPAPRNGTARIGFLGRRQRHEKGCNPISPIVAKLLEQALVKDAIR